MKDITRKLMKMCIVPGVALALVGCTQTGQNDNQIAVNGAEPAPASVTDPSQPVRAYVRVVHAVRGAGPVALAIDGENIVSDLGFGKVSEFIGVPGEKVKIHAKRDHQITAVGADGKALGEPLSLDLERGEDITVVIGGAPGKVTLTPFEHTNRGADMDSAKVAVLHADPKLPEVGITVDGDSWQGDVGYGEVTGYKILTPGSHSMKVMYNKSLVGVVDADRAGAASPPPPVGIRADSLVTLNQPLDLEAGRVYSVIVYQDAAGLPKLLFLEDKFVPTLTRAPEADTDMDGAANSMSYDADNAATNSVSDGDDAATATNSAANTTTP